MKKLSAREYAEALTMAVAASTPDKRSIVVKNFLQLLRRQRASNLLPRILDHLQRIDDAEHGQTRVQITSAKKIHETELMAALTKVLGPVVSELIIDPTLVGGLSIRVGDQLIDGSVRSRLQRLHTHLISPHA